MDKIKKSFAIIGMGRFGKTIALQLFSMGHEVLIIDKDERIIQNMADRVTQAVAGDAKDESVLRSMGIRNYDCCVVAIGDNITDSVLITLLLKELGVGSIICKAQDISHKKILMKIGADRVVIPELEMGVKVAAQLSSTNVIDFIDLTEEYGIADLKVPKKWIGKGLRDMDIRRKYGVNIIAVKDCQDYDKIAILPDADYVFHEGDILVMLGHDDAIKALGAL